MENNAIMNIIAKENLKKILSQFEYHKPEDLKAGQVYAYDDMKIVINIKDGKPYTTFYGSSVIPDGHESPVSEWGINKDWKLVEEESPTEVSATVKETSKTFFVQYDLDDKFNADDFARGELVWYDTKEEALDDLFENEAIMEVTVSWKEIPVEKPSFESELAELKRKYGKV